MKKNNQAALISPPNGVKGKMIRYVENTGFFFHATAVSLLTPYYLN